jgi:hypothetical protein
MNPYTHTYEVQYIERSQTNLQVLYDSLFYLTEILNMMVVQHFEVMLGQKLNNV